MDSFDLPPSALVEMTCAAIFLVALSLAVGAPVAVYRTAARRFRDSWDVRTHAALSAGVYRGMLVDVPAHVRVPRVVSVASLFSLYMAVPAVAALPVVAVGLCLEAARHSAGPAFVLGLPGLALGIAIVAVGVAMLKRSRAVVLAARVVATWALVYGLAILFGVMTFSLVREGSDWDALGLDEAGLLFVGVAGLVGVSAITLFASAAAHARVADRYEDERDTVSTCA